MDDEEVWEVCGDMKDLLDVVCGMSWGKECFVIGYWIQWVQMPRWIFVKCHMCAVMDLSVRIRLNGGRR